MRKCLAAGILLGCLLAAPAAAVAQVATPDRTPRQARPWPLGPRIRDGVRSGELTRGELERLRQRIAALRAHLRSARGPDGRLAPDARRHLRREWRQTSRLLFALKHNQLRRGRLTPSA